MIEHELKFLVDVDKWRKWKFDNGIGSGVLLEQFYAPETINGFEVRFRSTQRSMNWGGDVSTTLTFKRDTTDPSKRLEFEFRLNSMDLDSALNLSELMDILGCSHRAIRKRRIRDNSFIGMVDEYRDGLIVYEVEDPLTDFVPPPFVTEDVTGNPEYKNSNLFKSL